jgi:hypothetical protein
MDNQKFDSLVKTLASPTSRRRVLKGVGAISAGGLLTALGRQTTEAAPCPPNKKRCGGQCIPEPHFCAKGGGPPDPTSPGQVGK